MKLNKFEIKLFDQQNKPRPFHCGQSIDGLVSFTVLKRVFVNSVHVVMIGDSKVHWHVLTGSGKKKKSSYVHDRKIHMSFDINLVKNAWLNEGPHSYQFSLVIPHEIPQSFEHSCGRTRFTFTGIINIPYAFDKSISNTIQVSCAALQRENMFNEIASVSDKRFGLVFKEAPVHFWTILPKTFLIVGEDIMVKWKCDNKSNRKIDFLEFSFDQVLRFSAKERFKTKKINHCPVIKNIEVKPQYSDEETFTLTVPALPSSQDFEMISINYIFKVIFGSSHGIASRGKIKIPVTISNNN